LFVCSCTDGFKLPVRRQLTGEEQRKFAAGLWQIELPRRDVERRGWRLPAADDALSAWFRDSDRNANRRTVKKWNHIDDMDRYDAENFRSQYNILDQIGSNIIRRK